MIFNGSNGYRMFGWKCGQFTLDVCRKLIGQLGAQLGKHRDIGFDIEESCVSNAIVGKVRQHYERNFCMV